MTDVDGLLFDNLQPVACIDFKHAARSWRPWEASIRAQRNLADAVRSERAPNGLPFFVVRYWPDAGQFEAHAMNDAARAALMATGSIDGTAHGCPFRALDVAGYVQLEAHLRGLPSRAIERAIAGASVGLRNAAVVGRIPWQPAA